jgi:hypothetical protein
MDDVCSFANSGEWRREDSAFVMCKGWRTDQNVVIYKVGEANCFESCSSTQGYVNMLLESRPRLANT